MKVNDTELAKIYMMMALTKFAEVSIYEWGDKFRISEIDGFMRKLRSLMVTEK